MYILLTKREVKMAGYWPRSLFAFFMDRDEVEVHKNVKEFVKYVKGFVNHSPAARDLQILLVFYQHPAWFISL